MGAPGVPWPQLKSITESSRHSIDGPVKVRLRKYSPSQPVTLAGHTAGTTGAHVSVARASPPPWTNSITTVWVPAVIVWVIDRLVYER